MEKQDAAALTNGKLIALCKGLTDGPLLIAIGQMHGNEPAGTAGIRRAEEWLKAWQAVSPDRTLRGTFAGICGNMAAARAGLRFVREDLNRLWRPDRVERLLCAPLETLHEDERELVETLRLVHQLRDGCAPGTPMVVLDLHTTTAAGGSFALAGDSPLAAHLANGLQAPVVHGMLAHLQGTALSYFTEERFAQTTTGLAYEAGQHSDPQSPKRVEAAILQVMRALRMLPKTEDRGPSSGEAPRHLRLVYRHPVETGDGFSMRPGYENFQSVSKDEWLANDRNGPILCPADGFMLMPLYQKQGSDGFFILQALDLPST